MYNDCPGASRHVDRVPFESGGAPFFEPTFGTFFSQTDPPNGLKMVPKWKPVGLRFPTLSKIVETLFFDTPHTVQAGRVAPKRTLSEPFLETFFETLSRMPLEPFF